MSAQFYLIPFAARRSAVAYQISSDGWNFDLTSFLIGFVSALLLVGLAYRYRATLARYRSQITDRVGRLRRWFTASMAARYSSAAIESAQKLHLFGSVATLDKIYVKRHLRAPLAAHTEDAPPLLLSPSQAVKMGQPLLIIGPSGSGRTTLLNHLLLTQASQLHAAGEGERVPMYVYLPLLAVQMGDTATGEESESSAALATEQLAQAAVTVMSRLTATGVPSWLRGQVQAGQSLILLDGWEQGSPQERPAVTAWIKKLLTVHPDNVLVVTAGERGYAPLIAAGFIPLQPVPWAPRQLGELARRWKEVWPTDDQEPQAPSLHVAYRLTPPTPLEATIQLFVQLRGKQPAPTPAGRMAQAMDLLLPPPERDQDNAAWPLKTGHQALGRLALTTIERHNPLLGRDKIQSTVTQMMPPPRFTSDQDDATEGQPADKATLKAAREEEESRNLQVIDCCRALTLPGGIIRSWDNEHYFFNHPLVAAYWAAHYLASTEEIDGAATAAEHVQDPAWADALHFYVGLAAAEPLIQHLMRSPNDLFLSRLWGAADLMSATPARRVAWRQELIKQLAQLMLTPHLPPFLQSRALAALVESGEPSVRLLFKRIVDHANPQLRAKAILGLGILQDPQDLEVIEAALSDPDLDVRLAAIDALRRLARAGHEPALESIVASIVEAENQVQRAAAEALAELGPEGEAVLRDAAQDQDLTVRRAAVYGIMLLDADWVEETLQQLHLQDSEWLVRNAASEALAQLADEEQPALELTALTLPKAEQESWLIAWAAEQGEGTGVGDAALATLTRALREGDAPTRQAAVNTLRRLANPDTCDVLRQCLRDPEPAVRDAALSALYEISRRHDLTLTT